MLNYSTIPLIVVICYIAITAIKSTRIESKWYPLISCGLGMLIGVAMHYIVPEFIGATSLIVAIISGGVSGLAATGSNQVLKQLMKSAENGELKVDTSEPAVVNPTDESNEHNKV